MLDFHGGYCGDTSLCKSCAEIENLKAENTRLRKEWEKMANEVNDLVQAKCRAEGKLFAITNAGHSDDCAGIDIGAGRCGCGWLQREGAHACITALERRAQEAEDKEREACWRTYLTGIIEGEG